MQKCIYFGHSDGWRLAMMLLMEPSNRQEFFQLDLKQACAGWLFAVFASAHLERFALFAEDCFGVGLGKSMISVLGLAVAAISFVW